MHNRTGNWHAAILANVVNNAAVSARMVGGKGVVTHANTAVAGPVSSLH